uniref:Uncharacterized protein n=1 Tax=Panstrongylus megistus TaxID=65343 RepID=A0A069DTH8_9HEMI
MLSLKNWFNVSSTISVRTYRKRLNPIKLNPGIDRRLKLYKEEQADLANIKLNEECLDNLEEDIYNSKDLRTSHAREVKKLQSKILLKQIERKHFTTQKLPNMLLWTEKEQIRLLSQSDPDLWTPEKLSECFPATSDIIIKLLKSQWKPANNERIKTHDKRVSANWAAFEMGKLNLPDYISRHLKFFTSRKKIAFKKEENLPEKSEPKIGEFADIIRKYKNTRILTKTYEDSNMIPPLKSIENDTYVLNNIPNSRRRMKECTLEEIEKVHAGEANNDLSIISKRNDESNLLQGCLNESTFSKPYNNNVKTVEEESTYQVNNRFEENFLMKIKIPKEKWKKGCIYKVNNCYYSDDGEFLYRI